jgi:signal transduction histidine kinase/CheY-like chemotaxis protein
MTFGLSRARLVETPLRAFIALSAAFIGTGALLLALIHAGVTRGAPGDGNLVAKVLLLVFAALVLVSLPASWWLVKRRERRRAAETAAARRHAALVAEVAAHRETDAALQRAKAAAEAANLAKTRYLVGVSHEIRSPLNAIYGYAQLLERQADISPQEAGGVIRRSSEHLANIVDGLLDISRIESGVLKLNRDVVPLPAFLDSLVEMFRVQAENKGLQFHYHPPLNLPAFVRTDEKRLRQILINLLSNAIKYTPAGQVSLTVRHHGLIAEFHVADTGTGIAPADIERIFEPFERGSDDVAQGQPGTGLGLAITRVLAQVMGGDVSVTSTPGKGSLFKLRLMLVEPGDAVAATARKRMITGYVGRRRTILLIDDDPLQLGVLQNLLRPLGLTVYAASHGQDGLDLARRCAPDLVLLDIQMPGLSGWQVAERLRAQMPPPSPEGRPLKIILVSANAHEFAAGGDGQAAHDGFIAKPVELEALLDVIAGQLGLAWLADGAENADSGVLPATDLSTVAAHLAELRRLGQAGHIRGVEAALTTLAADLPASAPLVEALRTHVRAFDLEAYLQLLDAHG